MKGTLEVKRLSAILLRLILTKQSDKQANERVIIAIMMMARGAQNATITPSACREGDSA